MVLGALVAVPTFFTAVGLLPELTIPVPSNNDDATHFLLIQRMSEAFARGENPLDFWLPQVESQILTMQGWIRLAFNWTNRVL